MSIRLDVEAGMTYQLVCRRKGQERVQAVLHKQSRTPLMSEIQE